MAKRPMFIMASTGEYTGYENPDNQKSKGVLDLPSDDQWPGGAVMKNGCMDFAAMIDTGESPNTGDVNMITANGVASSKGKGSNQQPAMRGTDGDWNNDMGWAGGNRTGE